MYPPYPYIHYRFPNLDNPQKHLAKLKPNANYILKKLQIHKDLSIFKALYKPGRFFPLR